jgi:hypothetical protein
MPLYTIEKVNIQETSLADIQLSTCMDWTSGWNFVLAKIQVLSMSQYLIPCVSFGLYLVEISLESKSEAVSKWLQLQSTVSYITCNQVTFLSLTFFWMTELVSGQQLFRINWKVLFNSIIAYDYTDAMITAHCFEVIILSQTYIMCPSVW